MPSSPSKRNSQESTPSQRVTPRVRKTLHFRINLLFLLLLLTLFALMVVVIQTIGKPLMINENYKFIRQKGQTLVTHLGQRVSYAEALAKALASMGTTLPKDVTLFKKTIPAVLYAKEPCLNVAGGGIWPEPEAFTPGIAQRSFFWGCGSNNKPRYFDDYNNPKGPGYHNEEWYVPAKYLDPSAVYWSESYIDPYSSEPMVTCTAPMYENKKFTGTSTVDLKLTDLNRFLDTEAKALEGYIFALDRNNRFLSFPDLPKTKTGPRIEIKEETSFIHINRLAEQYPQFSPLSNALEKLNQDFLSLASGTQADQTARTIADQTSRISLDQARLIVAAFLNQDKKVNSFAKFNPLIIDHDVIVDAPAVASIFLMPETYWKIVIVSPQSQVTKVSRSVSKQIFTFMALAAFLCLAIAYLYLRSVLISPLQNMTNQLIKAVQDKKSRHPLSEKRTDELGNLAFWFNRRTEELDQEIISRKASQKALVQSEKRYKAMFDSSRDAILITDENRQILDCNPAALDLFQTNSKEEFFTLDPNMFFPECQPDGQPSIKRIQEINQTVLESGFGVFELTLQRLNKEVFFANISTSKVKLDNRIVFQTTIRDVSQQKRTQEMMIQAEKMMSVGGLAAGMAHEINNPLAGMMQNAQLIQNRLTRKDVDANKKAARQAGTNLDTISTYAESRGIFRLIDNVLSSGDRAAKIVKNMLSFSRKSDKVFSSHDLTHLLDETFELAKTDYDVKKQYDFKQVTVKRQYDLNLPMVSCDKGKIQQVFLNIIKNGVQAMQGAGLKSNEMVFTCRVFEQGTSVVASINDNGPGLTANIKKRIFEPFYTTKGVDQGTGLGLSVSYFIIVDDHGGQIEVESKPGQGTTIIIRLPSN